MKISVLIKRLSIDELFDLKKLIEKELLYQLRKSETSVDVMDLNITVRALNCLRHNKIKTLDELTCIKPSQLKGAGEKTIQEITECLTERGMNWGLTT